jgi:hypothetical protein
MIAAPGHPEPNPSPAMPPLTTSPRHHRLAPLVAGTGLLAAAAETVSEA